jgi:hypothetical protein
MVPVAPIITGITLVFTLLLLLLFNRNCVDTRWQ